MNFMARHVKNLFFNFASCEPLNGPLDVLEILFYSTDWEIICVYLTIISAAMKG